MNASYDIGEIADIQAIANVLACHSRGVDRADAGLLSNCYHPDATVDYHFFAGSATQFAEFLTDRQKQQPVTLHRTAQMWIKLEGDTAMSESYAIAYVSTSDEDGEEFQRLICGRYLDLHSRREGEWRLAHRTYVLDTNVNWRGAWERPHLGPLESQTPVGAHGAADAGIALLAQARAHNNIRGTDVMTHDKSTIDAVISRQQIADLTMAYCRGVDRADSAMLAGVFHEDATVVSGVFNGPAREFATEICTLVEEVYDQTFHSIANQWVEVDGDGAVGETYVIAVSTSRGDGEPIDTLTGGRYIDRFERRGGRWAIAQRTFVLDWARSEPSTREMDGDIYGPLKLHGQRGANDPVYTMFNK